MRSMSSNGPMREARRADRAVDLLDRAVPPSSIRSASSVNGRLTRLTMKPGVSAAADRRLAPAGHEPASPRSTTPGSVSRRRDHLDERHDRRRVEEVEADDPLRTRRRGGDRGDGQGARVRREDRRRVGAAASSAAKTTRLQLEVLDGRLDRRGRPRRQRPRGRAPPQPVEPAVAAAVGLVPASSADAFGGAAGRARRRSAPAPARRRPASRRGGRPRRPASSATWAIPAPIVPAPTTPTRTGVSSVGGTVAHTGFERSNGWRQSGQ